MMKLPLLPLAALTAATSLASAQVTLHNWDFDETAGTGIEATVNTGSAASGGLPTFAAPGASNNVGDWATTGSGALRITGFNTDANTLVSGSVATLLNLDSGQLQFEYQVSWNLPDASGVNRSLYLINRDQGGSNRFRWSINQYSSGTSVFITRDSSPGGLAEANAAADVGLSGNAILRHVFTFGDVSGSSGVTDIDASLSLNGGAFTDLGLTITPFAVANLNDLRLHGKGTFPDAVGTYYFQIDEISITAVPEPATYAAVLGLFSLGLMLWRHRR